MASSFLSGLAGLRSNQSWIDVIGNNLANSSTPGFKSSRALFSDLLNRTLAPATAPGAGFGGTNPMQIGNGVQVGSVDRDFNQGVLSQTGRTFDLGLQGRGFFGLTDGANTYYTRVGTFGLDANNNMVDLRTGLQVLDSGGSAFQVDLTSVVPPSATSNISFGGNLPAEVNGPLAEELTTGAAFGAGTAAQLTGSATGPFAVPVGETWTMELRRPA